MMFEPNNASNVTPLHTRAFSVLKWLGRRRDHQIHFKLRLFNRDILVVEFTSEKGSA